MMKRDYIIVTPMRNEREHLGSVAEEIGKQTVLPVKWIIVDDGSADGSCELAEELSSGNELIEVIKKADRGCDYVGGGVAETVLLGYEAALKHPFDFLVKMDADIVVYPDYFKDMLEKFHDDERLGIASGMNHISKGESLKPEKYAYYHPAGGARMYRRECFEQTGLEKCDGWDTIDIVKAQMRGWKTRCFQDLKVIHLRPTSMRVSAKGILKQGRTAYKIGYPPLYFLVRAVYRIQDPPYLLRTILMVGGYFSSWIKRHERHMSRPEIEFFRKVVKESYRKRLFGRFTRAGSASLGQL